MFYRFNKDSLEWKRDWKVFRVTILITVLLMIASFLFGKSRGNMKTDSIIKEYTKHIPIGSQPWVDSVFAEYERDADKYLSQKQFKSTPIKGHMLRLAAHNAFDSTGIILPVGLALAQAQLESYMGTKGRSPEKNPYNVGEYDNRTVKYFETTFDGVQAYYYLMCRNYLRCKTMNHLFKNFTNCSGNRYASSKGYEKAVSSQYNVITKYINKKK